ncbi:Uncharacterised protein [uncultured archaeon]|nr:Uncharacterised protein [uncultured archaeon]
MKRGTKTAVFLFAFVILLSSFAFAADTATITLTQPLKSTYNLGDTISPTFLVVSSTPLEGDFYASLICNNNTINFCNNGVSLGIGGQHTYECILRLSKSKLGGSQGTCVIKATVGTYYGLSDEFKISNLLTISGVMQKSTFDSGENVPISGKVTRETGENARGFIQANIDTNSINQNISQLGAIENGNFAMNISLPSDTKAGDYILNLNAYEVDVNGFETNTGNVQYNISVRQVPTNLELTFENKELNPGSSLKVKATLHDQTGVPINSTVFITIKDSADKILEEKEVNTDEFMEYSVASDTPPAEWKVYAVSNKLTSEDTFLIKIKESIKVSIMNKTIQITNDGNVFYNKTLLVKVEDNPLNIGVSLDVGQSKKYVLTAPNGQYIVKVLTNDGNEVSETMSLTGNVIGIKELSAGSLTTFAWILVILILLAVAFIFFKKLRKKPFYGRKIFQKREPKPLPVMRENSIVTPVNRAEVSLSIKGNKEDVSIVGIRIRDLRDLKRGSTADTIRKIISNAENSKAVMYENNDYLLFIFAPSRTRTMKNEKSALEFAESAQKILLEHNRMFNQKLDFGISLENGALISKVEDGVFKFMGMGTLMTSVKRIASLSREEVLLSNQINDSLRVSIKAEKEVRDGVPVFILGSIKKEDEAAKKFINKFLNRQDKE